MKTTSYNSGHPSLFEATWQEFSRFLSKYQYTFDHPSHSPRKTEIKHAIQNRGKKGCCTFLREKGNKYILHPLQAWVFDQAITNKQKLYYVSYGEQALLYFDIDLHHDWQTEEEGQRAKQLLEDMTTRFFGESVLFWNESSRGFNGYLKVDLDGMAYPSANERFNRTEHALQLFLAHYENLADFEIKGKLSYLDDDDTYTWKHYGKQPIHTRNWNFPRLKEFKSKPMVSIHRLAGLCQTIENQVAPEVLERHKQFKKSEGDGPLRDGKRFLVTPEMEEVLLTKYGEAWRCHFIWEGTEEATWLPEKYHRPGREPITEQELREAQKQVEQITHPQQQPEPPPQEQPVKAPKTPLKINIKLVDLASEPDSFKRQKEALFRYARYLKRVPILEEALAYLHDQGQFTPPWEENQAHRETRVRDILKWIAGTFDASKCANGSVNVSKYDAWAAKKFPKGLIGGKRKYLTEDGEIIELHQNIHISPTFIAVFMAIAEFALLINKNQDDSLPHRRAEELWQTLYAKELIPVKFCAKKWAVCREALVSFGIIGITNRDYSPGKAMKWDVGVYFPSLGLWKGKKLASLPVSIFRKKRRTREQ